MARRAASEVVQQKLKEDPLAAAVEVATLCLKDGPSMRLMRVALGLKQTELAGLLECAGESVSRWETGANPAPKAYVALLHQMVMEARTGSIEMIKRLERLNAVRT